MLDGILALSEEVTQQLFPSALPATAVYPSTGSALLGGVFCAGALALRYSAVRATAHHLLWEAAFSHQAVSAGNKHKFPTSQSWPQLETEEMLCPSSSYSERG